MEAFTLQGREATIVTTTGEMPGRRIVAVHGLVQGNVVRARHLGRDIDAANRNLVGGEILRYGTAVTTEP